MMRRAGLLLLGAVFLLSIACSGGGSSPAPTATSSPSNQPPPIATASPVTPTPVPAHPPGTRSGVDVVDGVLAAVESGDGARVLTVLSFHAKACDNLQGPGSTPCPEGVARGSPVDVVAFSDCRARYLARGTADLGSALRDYLDGLGAGRLYAVTEVNPARFSSPLPFKYLAIFANGYTLLLDDAGITHFGTPCGRTSPADLFHPADRVILPPP